LPEQFFKFFDPYMKSPAFYGLVTAALAMGGCNTGQIPAPPAQPNEPAVQQPVSEKTPLPDDSSHEGGPSTPGRAIYGEVVAATDQIIEVLEHADLTAADLRGATRRFEVAARNWKLYVTNINSTETAALQQSQLAEHAVTSGVKLRAGILRVAHNPAAEGLSFEVRNLLHALEQMMSATERGEFQQWVSENQLDF
jgi:hypothetical protein